MKGCLLALMFACACSSKAPTPAPHPSQPPSIDAATSHDVRVSFSMSDMQEDGDKRCAAALTSCAHVFAELDAPPGPCANKGTRCMEPMPEPKGWICRCEACSADADCEAGSHCEKRAPTCPQERVPGTCQKGPAPPPLDCPARPSAR